jgi:hypothetical protein
MGRSEYLHVRLSTDVKRVAARVLDRKEDARELGGIYVPKDEIQKFWLRFGRDGLLIARGT